MGKGSTSQLTLPSDSSLSLLEGISLLGLKQQFTGCFAEPVNFGNVRMGLWMKDGERERELAHSWDLSLEESPCFKACSY